MPLTQYFVAATIDGFIADEHDDLGWLLQIDDEKDGTNPYDEFIEDTGVLAMGATTFEWIQRHYPGEWFYAAQEKNIWLVGGGDLVGQFLDHDLLDEIWLTITPVILGKGAPLLPRRRTTPMTLQTVRAAGNGTFVHLRYSLR